MILSIRVGTGAPLTKSYTQSSGKLRCSISEANTRAAPARSMALTMSPSPAAGSQIVRPVKSKCSLSAAIGRGSIMSDTDHAGRACICYCACPRPGGSLQKCTVVQGDVGAMLKREWCRG